MKGPGDTSMSYTDVTRRVVSALAGFSIYFCVGSVDAVSAWNAQLKTELGYSHGEMQLVLSLAVFGALFGVPPGYVHDRLGSHKSAFIGATMLGAIYFGLAYGIQHYPQYMSSYVVGVLLAMAGQVAHLGIFAALVTNEGLFGPAHRGKIISFGLASDSAGAASFAVIYSTYYDANLVGYFYFLCILFAATYAFAWLTLYPHATKGNGHEREEALLAPPEESQLLPDVSKAEASGGNEYPESAVPVEEEITGMELLRDTRFWFLFIIMFIMDGAAKFIISNISFVTESIGGPMDQVPKMVALYSITSCAAKLVTGALSDYFLDHIPRVHFMSLSSVLMMFTFVLFLVLPPSAVVVPVTLCGVSIGVLFASFPVITREVFGIRHLGFNFGVLSLACALGYPLAFSPISSFVYNYASQEAGKCLGYMCFAPTFAVAFVAGGFSLFYCIRFAQRQSYKQLQ